MVHKNVGRIRRARGLTKSHLARKLSMSAMGYSHLESGDVRLDVERLKVIADALSVDPAVFFDDKLTDSVIKQIKSEVIEQTS